MTALGAKPETQFVKGVHSHLPPPSKLYREKMNNPYRGGTADQWYSAKKDLWVEYKFLPTVPQRGVVHLCKIDVKSPDLSVLQQRWLRGRYEEGRNVAVIVGCPSGGVILQDLEWEKAMSAAEFRGRIMSRQDLAHWIMHQVSST